MKGYCIPAYQTDPQKEERPRYIEMDCDLDICLAVKLTAKVDVDERDVEDNFYCDVESETEENFIKELKELIFKHYPQAEIELVDKYSHIQR